MLHQETPQSARLDFVRTWGRGDVQVFFWAWGLMQESSEASQDYKSFDTVMRENTRKVSVEPLAKRFEEYERSGLWL